MKALIALVFFVLCLGSGVSEAVVAQARDDEGTVVTIQDAPCENQDALKELPKLNALLRQAGMAEVTELSAADVAYKGVNYGACWTVIGASVVLLDDGGKENSIFGVPAAAFRVTTPL